MRHTNRAMKTVVVFGVLLGGLAGCEIDLLGFLGIGDTQDPPVDDPSTASKRLVRFESADELGVYFAEQSRNSQSRGGVFDDVDFALSAADGAGAPGAPGAPTNDAGGSGGALAESGQGDDGGARGGNFSTTTEQEEGVQEADVIKNDGEYLYVLSRGYLRIVKAAPVEAMEEMSSIDLKGYGFDMYLAGDKVIAITTPVFDGIAVPDGPVSVDGGTVGGGSVQTASLVADYFYQPRVEVTVIDVADRSNPTVLSRTQMDGNVNTTRMIGNRLYLVMVHYPDFLPMIAEAGVGQADGGRDASDVIPNIKIEMDGEEVVDADIAEPTDFYRPVDPDGWGLTTVVSFDIDTPTDYQAQSIVGYPANTYMSTEALYLTNTDFNFNGNMRETTDIYKFAVVDGGTELSATGSIPGRVLNQYSMSEHNGFLRLASTVGPSFNRIGQNASQSKNNVYVLEQVEDALTVAGKVEGLAPGETIQSARFLGDRGFLVTFVQVDPLFTLDLSDPRDPKVVGELKIPGFSTYITPMGENHLLTIGRDGSDEFGFVRVDGVRLSIFDVTDFANPTLAHFEVIGSGGAYSEALFNPKAFTYFAERNLLAFPVEIYGFNGFEGFGGVDPVDPIAPQDDDLENEDEGKTLGDDGEDLDGGVSVDVIDLPQPPSDFFNGVYVYEVTPGGGFSSLGRINTSPDADRYYGLTFSRGSFIGDYVYATTSEGIKASMVSSVENVISKVDFPTPDFSSGFGEGDGEVVGPPETAVNPEVAD